MNLIASIVDEKIPCFDGIIKGKLKKRDVRQVE